MSPLGIKLSLALAILAIGLVGGLIPILVSRRSTSHRFLSLGNALSGGIFLGAGFMHLLPEAGEALGEAFDYPVAPLLAAGGVCLLLLIDRVLFESIGSAGATGTKPKQKSYNPPVLLAVLSTHALIAGIAVGLESEAAALVFVAVAIVVHKGSAAFALIVSLLSAGSSSRKAGVTLAAFAAITPIGIVGGMTFGSYLTGQTAVIWEGAFNAVAAGTFIYIAIVDVIGSELSTLGGRVTRSRLSARRGRTEEPIPKRDPERILKFTLVLAGLGTMAVVGIWA